MTDRATKPCKRCIDLSVVVYGEFTRAVLFELTSQGRVTYEREKVGSLFRRSFLN